jgi:hypothetical protein
LDETPFLGGDRRFSLLRTDRQAAGQRFLGRRRQRPQDLILGDLLGGDRRGHSGRQRGADRHDRKDCGKIFPSRHL